MDTAKLKWLDLKEEGERYLSKGGVDFSEKFTSLNCKLALRGLRLRMKSRIILSIFSF